MDDFNTACPTLAALMTVDEFKTRAVVLPAPTLPVEPAKPQLTKGQALDLVDYFAHISCNPCPPKYCGVNVDVAADRLGIPRSYAYALYDEYQHGLAVVAVAQASPKGEGDAIPSPPIPPHMVSRSSRKKVVTS